MQIEKEDVKFYVFMLLFFIVVMTLIAFMFYAFKSEQTACIKDVVQYASDQGYICTQRFGG